METINNKRLLILIADIDSAFAEGLKKSVYQLLAFYAIEPMFIYCSTLEQVLSQKERADLVFLDLDFPLIEDGIRAGEHLYITHNSPLMIAFGKNNEYALQGLRLHAYNYLVKDEWPEQFEAVILEAIAKLYRGSMLLAQDRYCLKINSIVCVEKNDEDGTKVCENGYFDQSVFQLPLTWWAAHLGSGFTYCNEDCLINGNQIETIGENSVVMKNGMKTSLSPSNRQDVERVKNYY